MSKSLTVADEILEAAEPFVRVLTVNAPFLNAKDGTPLRSMLDARPTWGEFKRLMTAISVIDEARKRVGVSDVKLGS